MITVKFFLLGEKKKKKKKNVMKIGDTSFKQD